MVLFTILVTKFILNFLINLILNFFINFVLTFTISKSNSKNRIYSEIQVTTISQANYEPANHNKYKQKRNEKWDEVFYFDESKVHIKGYYPKFGIDYSGLIEPMYVTEKPRYN